MQSGARAKAIVVGWGWLRDAATILAMAGLVPYVFFSGDARAALTFYADVFGGELVVHTFKDFGRTDGPPDSVAHGILTGPVELFGADSFDPGAGGPVRGVAFSLLGAAEPPVLHRWFGELAEGGTIVEPLQRRA